MVLFTIVKKDSLSMYFNKFSIHILIEVSLQKYNIFSHKIIEAMIAVHEKTTCFYAI